MKRILIFLCFFVFSKYAVAEIIISLKYEPSVVESNSIVSAAKKRNIESLPVYAVSAFRYTKPKLATVVFGPYNIQEHTFFVSAVNCTKKFTSPWRCKDSKVYKFMYFGEISKAIRIGENIDYNLARKLLDFSKTTNCYPRFNRSNLAVDREGLEFSESLSASSSDGQYYLEAEGCGLVVSIKNDLISVVNIAHAFE